MDDEFEGEDELRQQEQEERRQKNKKKVQFMGHKEKHKQAPPKANRVKQPKPEAPKTEESTSPRNLRKSRRITSSS